MAWDISVKDKVYKRLANEIFFRILNGYYALGQKLPSYVDIAKAAGSSPETVRKAFQELEGKDVILKTCWGYFVTTEQDKISDYRNGYLQSIEERYLEAQQKIKQ